MTDGSDLVTFDGHPKDRPSVVYKDVWVFVRRPIANGETDGSKFTRESFGALGWTLVRDTYSHLSTVKVVCDSYGAKDQSFLRFGRVVHLVAEVHAGHYIGTAATMGKLLDEWLRNLERLGKARSTMETYKIRVEKHTRPDLGVIRLEDRLGVVLHAQRCCA